MNRNLVSQLELVVGKDTKDKTRMYNQGLKIFPPQLLSPIDYSDQSETLRAARGAVGTRDQNTIDSITNTIDSIANTINGITNGITTVASNLPGKKVMALVGGKAKVKVIVLIDKKKINKVNIRLKQDKKQVVEHKKQVVEHDRSAHSTPSAAAEQSYSSTYEVDTPALVALGLLGIAFAISAAYMAMVHQGGYSIDSVRFSDWGKFVVWFWKFACILFKWHFGPVLGIYRG